jgi:hypothetical protein
VQVTELGATVPTRVRHRQGQSGISHPLAQTHLTAAGKPANRPAASVPANGPCRVGWICDGGRATRGAWRPYMETGCAEEASGNAQDGEKRRCCHAGVQGKPWRLCQRWRVTVGEGPARELWRDGGTGRGGAMSRTAFVPASGQPTVGQRKSRSSRGCWCRRARASGRVEPMP